MDFKKASEPKLVVVPPPQTRVLLCLFFINFLTPKSLMPIDAAVNLSKGLKSYFPLKLALRFSTKAVAPSTKSSVPARSPKAFRSTA